MIPDKEPAENNLFRCPICNEERFRYLFETQDSTIVSCSGCGLTYSQPDTIQKTIEQIQDKSGDDPIDSWMASKTETEASKRYIEILLKRIGTKSKILLVAPPNHCINDLAKESGLEVIDHIDIKDFENGIILDEPLDGVVFLYQIEKCISPGHVLDQAYTLMKPGGILLVITPSLDSRPARFFGNSWTEWRLENRFYFDNTSIQSLLLRYGFNQIQHVSDLRWYTLSHINERATGFPKTWLTRLVRLIYHILPGPLHNLYFRLPTSGMIVIATKTQRRERPLLSIVLPVYNESSTFPILMQQLIAKKIEEIDREIIIVESNSTDNSRHLVLEYQDRPGISVILQDKARGKGNAVRAGLEFATGDVILIQDADLEYDLNDYEALVHPVATFRRPFVLGSRHGGRWKMRQFSDQAQLSAYFNFGHVLFTSLINLFYNQHMKDPFTMFKVFRRDCIHDIKFECNRFDFDFELVIKLIRKGYTPVEIPVNYNSRSFAEGKKVNMLRDPLTWVRALIKYRFVNIYKERTSIA